MKTLLYTILPFLENQKANNVIRTRLKDDKYKAPKDQKLVADDCIEEYNATLDAVRKLEDKAKSLLIAWTITITLTLNLSGMVNVIIRKMDTIWFMWIVTAVAITAVLYMLIAGILVIQILTKENVIEMVTLEERTARKSEAFYTTNQRNIDRNIIRNNKLYSSYKCIINSSICLVSLFITRTLITVI